MLEKCTTTKGIFSFSIEQYICEFMMPSMKCSSPTPAALMQPHIRDTATTMFHCRHHAFFFVFLTFATPYSFEAISSKNIYLGLITPEYRVPSSLHLCQHGPWQTLGGLFLCLGFRRGFFRGRNPCMPFLCSVRRIVSREIVTPVWLSTSFHNCSELACLFSSTLLIRRRS